MSTEQRLSVTRHLADGASPVDPHRSELGDRADLRDTLRLLDRVDDLLGRLVVDEFVRPAMATRIEQVRDDLAGYVRAAGVMDEVLVSTAKVVEVLRRGVAAAKVAVLELDEELFRAGTPRVAGRP